ATDSAAATVEGWATAATDASDRLAGLEQAQSTAEAMIAASLEVAGRALVIAGTRVVDADLAEGYATNFWGLPSPYSSVPTDEDGYDQWVDDQNEYYDDLNDYMSETEDLLEGG
ncbi:MAG TPA: hypothetical protein VFO97_07570, partial [Desertimonas sp.]|nr:hypothetical protein [Desertimonas sp.]